MRSVAVRPADGVDNAIVHAVAAEFKSCHTLAHLMRWTASQTPPIQIAEIVTQDEYTHDVVVPFGDSILSFDTT